MALVKMTQKVKQSRQHAAVALAAYRETGNHSTDDVEAIFDLVADLLHLGEEAIAEAEREENSSEVAWGGAVSVPGLVDRCLDHWQYERDPEHADEEV